MIDVLLTRSDFEKARKRAEVLQARRAGSSLTLDAIKDFQIIGVLGEIAFGKYLAFIGARAQEHAENTGSFGDKWDFSLRSGGRTHYFDVKSTTKYDTVAVNARLAEKAKRNGTRLVGVRVDLKSGRAAILGHCLPALLARDRSKDFAHKGAQIEMYSVPAWALSRFKVDDVVVP